MSNARNISKADSRFVNATGDTMTGSLVSGNSITCKPRLTISGASTSSVPELRLDAYNYSGVAGDEQGGIVWVGGDASNPGYDTERCRIDAKMTDEYNRVGLSFKVGAYNNPVPYEAMSLDAHGRVTMPYQPAFYVYNYKSLTNGAYTFNSVHNNIGSHYSYSTGRFTAPVSGTYLFFASDYGGYYRAIGVFKNGTQIGESYIGEATGGQSASLTVSYYLSAGDYVYCGPTANSANTGGGTYWHFGGHLIG
jgi:hypothetical protein